jgi:hypothetical protein
MQANAFRCLCVLVLAVPALLAQSSSGLQTVAEKSDYRASGRHADVMAFCDQLAKAAPLVRQASLGESAEKRRLPLLILSDPPVATAEEARRSGKLVVFVLANIHAGEVDGKEAVLMLARDWSLPKPVGSAEAILKQLVVVIAPIFNADGNERISVENRRAQNGPVEGVGIRANAQGFDLNRDFVKLETPEVRALIRALNEWDPGVFIDCHTTNGSYHRYTLTYEGGRCPAGDAGLIAFTRDAMLPDVTRRLQQKTGFRSWFYGNFNADRSRWETVSPTPRYGTHYVGLRNRIAILSESYSHASFKDRVLASRGFVESICEYAAEHRDDIQARLRAARTALQKQIVIRHEPIALGRPVNILGWVETTQNGRRVRTDQPKDYEVFYFGDDKPLVTVTRPRGYLLAANLIAVRENLERHGIRMERLSDPQRERKVEIYRVEKLTKAAAFQRHQPVTLEVTKRAENRRFDGGWLHINTEQPLTALATYLLEPQSVDGLATWNFFDDALIEGADYPILRLVE